MKEVFITGNTVVSNDTIELFNKPTEKVNKNKKVTSYVDISSSTYPRRYIDYSWLKAASSIYHISPDLGDYVVVPVPIITSNIPNRNTQAFDLKDLLSFDSNSGRMAYQTFIGKPTHINHQNQIAAEAKGVNLDVSVIPVKKYNVAKIVLLSAYDRTKDRDLVKDIMNNQNGYSMGALAPYFVCSICGGILGPSIERTCTCYGSDFRDLRTLGNVVNGNLHYHIAKEFRFIECSRVDSPADVTALSNEVF